MDFSPDQSPLFVPQDSSSEGNSSPSQCGSESSKRGSGKSSGRGKGKDSGSKSTNTESNASEMQTNPQVIRRKDNSAFWEQREANLLAANRSKAWDAAQRYHFGSPSVKEESSPSPPLSPSPPPRPPNQPAPRIHKFAPLTSRNERMRRQAAAEAEAAAATATAAVTVAPNQAVASVALEQASQTLGIALQFADLAAKNASMHHTIAKNALKGNPPLLPAVQNNVPPLTEPPPQTAPPAFTAPPALPAPLAFAAPLAQPVQQTHVDPQRIDPLHLAQRARHHLDTLANDLRRKENEACEHEERLSTQLEQARDLRERAIEDRREGLAIIRAREREVRGLERRLQAHEYVEMDEMVEILKPLKLEEVLHRDALTTMEHEGREEDEASEEYWSG